MRPKTPEADKDAIEIISNGLPELLSVGGELGHNSSGQLELVAPRPVRPDSRGAVMPRTVEQEAHNAQFGYYETSRDIPQSFYDERTASLSRQASTELVGGNTSSGTINTSTVPVFNQASTPGVTNHSNEPLGPSNYNGSGYNSGRSNEPLGTSGPSYNSSSGPATSHSRELLGTAGPSGHSSASQPLGVPGPSGYNRRDATVQHDRTPTPNIPRTRRSNSGFNPDSPEFVPGAHQHQIPDLDVEPTPPPSEPSSPTEEAPPVHKRQRRVYDGHGDDLFTLDTGSAESLRRAASVTGVPRRTPRPPRATAARNNNSSSTPTGSNTQSPQVTQEPASPTVELPVRERSVQPSHDQGTRRVRDHHIQDSQSSLSSNFPNRRVNVQTVVGRQGDAPVGTLPLANTHNNAGANTNSGVSAGPGGPNMVVPDMPQQQRQNRALEIREQRQRAMNIRDVHMRNTLLQHLEGTVAAPLGLGGVRNPLNGQPAPVRTNGNFIIEPPRIIVPVPGPHALVARPRGNHMHNVEEPEMPAPARTHNIQDMPTPVGNAPRQANVRPPPMGQFNIFDIQGQTRAHPQGTVGTDTNQTPQVPNRPTAFQAWNAPRNLPIALALGTPRPIENINARRNDGVANMNRILGNQGFNTPQPAAFPTQPQFAQPNVARFPTIPPQDPWGHLTGNTTGAGFDNSGPSVFANPLRLPEDRPEDGFPRLFNFNTMMPVFPAEEPQPIAAQQPEPEIGLRSVSGNALNGFLVEREARRARDDEHIQQQLEDERAHAAQLEHEAAMTAEYIRHLQQLLERRDRQRRGE